MGREGEGQGGKCRAPQGRPHFLQGVRCVSHIESQGRLGVGMGAESVIAVRKASVGCGFESLEVWPAGQR